MLCAAGLAELRHRVQLSQGEVPHLRWTDISPDKCQSLDHNRSLLMCLTLIFFQQAAQTVGHQRQHHGRGKFNGLLSHPMSQAGSQVPGTAAAAHSMNSLNCYCCCYLWLGHLNIQTCIYEFPSWMLSEANEHQLKGIHSRLTTHLVPVDLLVVCHLAAPPHRRFLMRPLCALLACRERLVVTGQAFRR